MCQMHALKLGPTQHKLKQQKIQHMQWGSHSQCSTFEINISPIEEHVLKEQQDSESVEEHRHLQLAF